jgi:hypothetical protein
MKRIGYIAMQRLKSLKGQHVELNTEDSDKTIRINSRTYTVAASIIGMQCKPRAGVVMTNNIYGAEFEPGMNDGYAGVSVIGVASRPTLKGATGNMSGEIIAYEASLGSSATGARTVTNPLCCLRAYNNFRGTATGGIYIIHADTHGDIVPWSGLGKFPDDSQLAKTNEDKYTGTLGWIKVKIGTLTGYIAVGSLA